MSELGEWYEAQVELVAEGLKPVYDRLVQGIAADEVVGFGVISDPTDFTLTAAVNSKSHLYSQMKLYVELGLGSAGDAAKDCIWNPGEWDRFAMPSLYAEFPGVMRFAAEAQERTRSSDDVALGVMMFFETIVRAMAKLFNQGFFDDYQNAVQVFNVVDMPFNEGPFERWMGGINTASALESYRGFLALNS